MKKIKKEIEALKAQLQFESDKDDHFHIREQIIEELSFELNHCISGMQFDLESNLDSGVLLSAVPIDQFLLDKTIYGSVDLFVNPTNRNYKVLVHFGNQASKLYTQGKSLLPSIPTNKEDWIKFNSGKLSFDINLL